VWLTLKDVGKTMVFAAKPPFQVLRIIDTSLDEPRDRHDPPRTGGAGAGLCPAGCADGEGWNRKFGAAWPRQRGVHLALAAPDTGRTTAGAQIVNAVGPIRQFVDAAAQARDDRRYLVVMIVEHGKTGRPVQVQQPEVTRSSMDR
jgi:hypothetical protein